LLSRSTQEPLQFVRPGEQVPLVPVSRTTDVSIGVPLSLGGGVPSFAQPAAATSATIAIPSKLLIIKPSSRAAAVIHTPK
jgi:hypothetical protein